MALPRASLEGGSMKPKRLGSMLSPACQQAFHSDVQQSSDTAPFLSCSSRKHMQLTISVFLCDRKTLPHMCQGSMTSLLQMSD